jgi:hypothetical protein
LLLLLLLPLLLPSLPPAKLDLLCVLVSVDQPATITDLPVNAAL